MKIAWLVYRFEADTGEAPEFHTTEPEAWRGRIVQIAYSEIAPHD